VAQDPELLAGDMFLDPSELALKPAKRLAWLRHGFLLVGFHVEPQKVAHERPRRERRVPSRECLPQRTRVVFALGEE
jgi:hypothetical protein